MQQLPGRLVVSVRGSHHHGPSAISSQGNSPLPTQVPFLPLLMTPGTHLGAADSTLQAPTYHPHPLFHQPLVTLAHGHVDFTALEVLHVRRDEGWFGQHWQIKPCQAALRAITPSSPLGGRAHHLLAIPAHPSWWRILTAHALQQHHESTSVQGSSQPSTCSKEATKAYLSSDQLKTAPAFSQSKARSRSPGPSAPSTHQSNPWTSPKVPCSDFIAMPR